jgi:hypothetical protein
MFRSINIFGRKQRDSEVTMGNHYQVEVEMPDGSEGRTVSSRTLMMALLWQQYGLDLLHPEFSRWLEQNAPDVKFAIAQTGHGTDKGAELRAGDDGRIKVQLTPAVDRRLREVSSEYIFWQMEPEKSSCAFMKKDAVNETVESCKLAYIC